MYVHISNEQVYLSKVVQVVGRSLIRGPHTSVIKCGSKLSLLIALYYCAYINHILVRLSVVRICPA
jgi:hypothetical protein